MSKRRFKKLAVAAMVALIAEVFVNIFPAPAVAQAQQLAALERIDHTVKEALLALNAGYPKDALDKLAVLTENAHTRNDPIVWLAIGMVYWNERQQAKAAYAVEKAEAFEADVVLQLGQPRWAVEFLDYYRLHTGKLHVTGVPKGGARVKIHRAADLFDGIRKELYAVLVPSGNFGEIALPDGEDEVVYLPPGHYVLGEGAKVKVPPFEEVVQVKYEDLLKKVETPPPPPPPPPQPAIVAAPPARESPPAPPKPAIPVKVAVPVVKSVPAAPAPTSAPQPAPTVSQGLTPEGFCPAVQACLKAVVQAGRIDRGGCCFLNIRVWEKSGISHPDCKECEKK